MGYTGYYLAEPSGAMHAAIDYPVCVNIGKMEVMIDSGLLSKM